MDKKSVEEVVSENLTKLRKEHSISQRQVADALGMSLVSVNKYEKKRKVPSILTLKKFARFYNTTVGAIMGVDVKLPTRFERVLPVSEAKERTVREWFAKLDEQVNEFKWEIQWLYSMDDEIAPVQEAKGGRVAEEAADIYTVLASIMTRLAIPTGVQLEKQAMVNLKNMDDEEERKKEIIRSVYDLE